MSTPDDTITLSLTGSSGAPAADVAVPRDLGPVRVLREIGRGGMGVVYLGRHELLSRDVAVKFLPNVTGGPDDADFSRFVNGARAAAAVEHPGLIAIHHADVIENIPYLVMQYIDGPTLRDVVRDAGPLPPGVAVSAVHSVADAIAALHARGIIHRDIKPSNVLLDADGRIYVTDFGLACGRGWPCGCDDDGATGDDAPVRLAGTPAYMAPEMFGGTMSTRGDVYALGILMYEVLTGAPPFSGTVREVREQHLHVAVALERLSDAGVPEAIVDVVERATHKDAMFRYKTAQQFARAVADAGGGADALRHGARALLDIVTHRGEATGAPAAPASDATGSSSYFEQISGFAERKRQARTGAETDGDRGPHDVTPAPPAPPISGPEPLPAGKPIATDVPCAQCGYNLRESLPGAACPECGTDVSASMDRNRLVFADRAWLCRVVAGVTFLLGALPAGAVVLAGVWAIDKVFPLRWTHAVAVDGGIGTITYNLAEETSAAVIMVVVAVGVWLTTRREPLRGPAPVVSIARYTARVSAVLLPAVLVMPQLVVMLGDALMIRGTALSEVYRYAVGGCMVLTACAVLWYLAWLAGRIPDARLRRWSLLVGVVFAAVAALPGVVPGDVLGRGTPARDVHVVVTIAMLVAIWFVLALHRRGLSLVIAARAPADPTRVARG
ncbi:MAG: protein kinase [Phycisphaerae bacterium]